MPTARCRKCAAKASLAVNSSATRRAVASGLLGGAGLCCAFVPGLLGLMLLMMAFASAGIFVSSLTREPTIAAVGSFGLLLLIWLTLALRRIYTFRWPGAFLRAFGLVLAFLFVLLLWSARRPAREPGLPCHRWDAAGEAVVPEIAPQHGPGRRRDRGHLRTVAPGEGRPVPEPRGTELTMPGFAAPPAHPPSSPPTRHTAPRALPSPPAPPPTIGNSRPETKRPKRLPSWPRSCTRGLRPWLSIWRALAGTWLPPTAPTTRWSAASKARCSRRPATSKSI